MKWQGHTNQLWTQPKIRKRLRRCGTRCEYILNIEVAKFSKGGKANLDEDAGLDMHAPTPAPEAV